MMTRLLWLLVLPMVLMSWPLSAQDTCYVQQQLCNEACAGDTLCRIRTCFKEAVECQKRLDERAALPPEALSENIENEVVLRENGDGVEEVGDDAGGTDIGLSEDPRSAFRQRPKRRLPERPKTYVLPPVTTCASLSWEGDTLIEFIAANNCPAAIDADVLFSDGTEVSVYCDGYERCTASFPKVQVSEQFQYWLRYATD